MWHKERNESKRKYDKKSKTRGHKTQLRIHIHIKKIGLEKIKGKKSVTCLWRKKGTRLHTYIKKASCAH